MIFSISATITIIVFLVAVDCTVHTMTIAKNCFTVHILYLVCSTAYKNNAMASQLFDLTYWQKKIRNKSNKTTFNYGQRSWISELCNFVQFPCTKAIQHWLKWRKLNKLNIIVFLYLYFYFIFQLFFFLFLFRFKFVGLLFVLWISLNLYLNLRSCKYTSKFVHFSTVANMHNKLWMVLCMYRISFVGGK